MFFTSNASNDEIFIIFSKKDFWSEAERMKLLNFTQRYSCEMFASSIILMCPSILKATESLSKQSKLRISYGENNHKFKRREPLKNCAVWELARVHNFRFTSLEFIYFRSLDIRARCLLWSQPLFVFQLLSSGILSPFSYLSCYPNTTTIKLNIII